MVLSDINMPRMDGLTLLNQIQSLSRLLRAVIVSAYGDMQNIRTAMNRGAFDFVTKPIDFDDLEATINKTLADLTALREVYRARATAERAQANLARYFSPNLVSHLADNGGSIELGGERRELTFLATDLADFTSLVESLDPAAVVAVMNEYLGEVTRIVFAHGGTIDTVVGDAVHAMFGAPLEQPDHAARAVACALAIDAFSREFSVRKAKDGVPIGRTRIGVHTGSAIVGNFGGEGFFHYTAHGDAVNTASRLESVNKHLGTRICVSADTVARIPGFTGRPVGTLILKGKEQGIKCLRTVGRGKRRGGRPGRLSGRLRQARGERRRRGAEFRHLRGRPWRRPARHLPPQAPARRRNRNHRHLRQQINSDANRRYSANPTRREVAVAGGDPAVERARIERRLFQRTPGVEHRQVLVRPNVVAVQVRRRP